MVNAAIKTGSDLNICVGNVDIRMLVRGRGIG